MTSTFKKVFPYILLGVGIGALIHNWIPENWVESILGVNNPMGVVLAAVIGIPMYADIFGTIPIAEALLAKGAQLGTVLSFMMGVTTLSLPLHSYAAQGYQAPAVGAVYRPLCRRYHFGRICV